MSTGWNDKQDKELLKAWKARAEGVGIIVFSTQYAASVGRTTAAVFNRLYRLGQSVRNPIPESNHHAWEDEPRIVGDALILNDMHVPYHDAHFVNMCIETAHAMGITKAILGGDVVEQSSFSHWTADFPDASSVVNSEAREELEGIYLDMADGDEKERLRALLDKADAPEGVAAEEIREVKSVLRALAQNFDEVVWIMGNHEIRLIRMLERALPAQSMAELFGVDPKWKVSPYYWCELTSGGETYRITHPVNSAKGSSKKLAPKYRAHIIMAHNHHFSMQTDPSGKYLAIEPGACVDFDRLPYEVQRDSSADLHVQGAMIVQGGFPYLLNEWTDWDLLRKGNE